jgi:hypothetical protein
VQSQPIPALHAHYAPHQTTDQMLRVQIRRDHHRPSFQAPKRAPRRICPFANALHALPCASMVIHALGGLPTRRFSPAAPPTRSGTFWRVRSTLHINLWRMRLTLLRAYWRVSYTRPCSLHTLARALHALGAPHHYPAATCLSESRHVSPSSATCQASKKKKTDSDPIYSARSNGLEPDLLKWVRPSIGLRVSVF